jgi:hypothetical protein
LFKRERPRPRPEVELIDEQVRQEKALLEIFRDQAGAVVLIDNPRKSALSQVAKPLKSNNTAALLTLKNSDCRPHSQRGQ